ncbi:DUF4111 domain-containing protein [Facklamia miroungae]|uniref:Streptomycin 3-adenylyltransferase n=1 Tax=Facklamia miroungae TaxID=120956 RepID=A0A1G7UTZ3_9LACT|nr:DUF4111 domain-containing protein [Facklamia miroungae]SDG50946.1 streptomycin 3-adenylyltransferase [Facklamia miroungae]
MDFLFKEVFADVPSCYYLDSIWKDVANSKDNITKDAMYYTLNLVRILAYIEEKLVLSKKEGGEWAIKHLPVEYHRLIKDALCEYSKNETIIYDKVVSKRFAKYAITKIQKSLTR